VTFIPTPTSVDNSLYSILEYNLDMNWQIIEHVQYTQWFEEQEEGLQDEILAIVGLLKCEGPTLSRPYADTLEASQHSNMKELRIQYCGDPWRILFAFDPKRSAILLLGGNKAGNARWYQENIPIADQRFTEHLNQLQNNREDTKDGNVRRKNGSTKSRKKGKNRGKN
jgi:hypothetical protein